MNLEKINEEVWKEEILNENEFKDYIVSFIILLGSLGFLSVGISSYFNLNLPLILSSNHIVFFPQGITMCFYGFLGVILSTLQITTIYLKIGNGTNTINKINGTLEINRKGFPGENQNIKIIYKIKDIESIKIEDTNNILNTKKTILICMNNKKEIPFYQYTKFVTNYEIEKKASIIASILNVPLKNI
uniref:Photosystem I assembly protein Ycf4 n=1 Tax=Phacus orbicularis TaxID=158829 RepID=A0A182B0X5_9EUGL|nr:photosystem I assembly protein ycf4 [Phacus orbicularis]